MVWLTLVPDADPDKKRSDGQAPPAFNASGDHTTCNNPVPLINPLGNTVSWIAPSGAVKHRHPVAPDPQPGTPRLVPSAGGDGDESALLG
eukprot:6020997-Pyramimonas_sp.AAC.1